jgi:hypothetical protein
MLEIFHSMLRAIQQSDENMEASEFLAFAAIRVGRDKKDRRAGTGAAVGVGGEPFLRDGQLF